ncbi:hypothetical protein GOP47_0005620 [Adiantum capillus-veneris]|uniref:t-SNARE coiled-coil homology domain-containing protein n=1 Tax=Adiantum capillus-veneris TaxID=13818 RepID=A0A9D4ZNQ2_ADICA|nr:hypothetical protein GOP47_0005620 [Adiantum capillus-veneris]
MAHKDSWLREYEDAVRLSDDIARRLADRESGSTVLRPDEATRLISLVRRKLTMLGTKLDSLSSLLNNSSLNKSQNDTDLLKRQELVKNLRARMNQMSVSLSSLQDIDRSSLLGQEVMQAELRGNNRTVGLTNSGIITFQRQSMRDQDDDLLSLEETALSTKHVALAVNDELDLHARLLEELDEDVDITNNRMKVVQRRLAYLSKKASSNCSCMSLIVMVFILVFLILVFYGIVKYI